MLAAFAQGNPVRKPSGTPTTTSTTIGPRQLVWPSINTTWGSVPYLYTGLGPVSVTDMPPTATTTLDRRQLVAPHSGSLWGNLSNIVAQNVSVSNGTRPTIVAEAGMMTLAALNSPWKTNVRHDMTTIYATTTVQGVIHPAPTQALIPSCFDMDGNGYKGYYFRLRHFATKEEAIQVKEAAISFWIDRVYPKSPGVPGPYRPQRKKDVLMENIVLEDDGTYAFEVTLTQYFFGLHIVRGEQWENGWLAKVVKQEMGVLPYLLPGQMWNINGCWDPLRCEVDGGIWLLEMYGNLDKKTCMRPCFDYDRPRKTDFYKDGKRYCVPVQEISVPR